MSDAAKSAGGERLARPAAPARSLRSWRRLRFIPLVLGAAALAFGLTTGLARMGASLSERATDLSGMHGALMICGFLGTVISLERAVALARLWAYAAPALSALGAVGLLFGATGLAIPAFLAASLVLTLASFVIVLRQTALFTVVLAIAALCWGIGTFAWMRAGDSAVLIQATGWWLNFLVLTIAGERLELSRLLAPPRASRIAFAVIAALPLLGAMRGELSHGFAPLTGAGFLGLTLWLLRHDIARRTIRQTGQTRFSAVCMLAGYGWLGLSGLLLLVPHAAMAFAYDAAVHAVAIGFVLSMVFGHAPIILPAVSGLRVHYSAVAYAPLALLHGSVMLRLAADLMEWPEARIASGLLTVLALLGYAATLIAAAQRRR